MSEQLVDAATAARQLGMTRSSVYRLAKANKIPSYSAGPRLTGVRFDICELRAALKRAGYDFTKQDRTITMADDPSASAGAGAKGRR